MKRKELFWMIVPCLLLIGVGAHLSRRNAKREGPFRTVVTSIQLLPTNPREVSDGFDRKLEILVEPVGKPILPPNSRLTAYSFAALENIQFFQGDSPQPLKLPADFTRVSSIGTDMNSTLLLKLSKIPSGSGNLTLKAHSKIFYLAAVTNNGKKLNVQIHSRPAQISLIVRRAGEVVAPPSVSHANPFVVRRVEVEDACLTHFPANPYQSGDVILSLYSDPLPTNGSRKPNVYDTYIEDEKGQKHSSFRKTGINYLAPIVWIEELNGEKRMSFDLRLSQISASAGRLTFKSKVSVDDCWPLQMSFVLRERGARDSYATGQKRPVVLKPNDVRLRIN